MSDTPKKYAAVFTDSRPLMNLDLCARDHMRFLPPDWDCVFFTSKKNAYVTLAGAHLIEISEDTTDSLLKLQRFRVSSQMWTPLLKYDRVLIFEQDSRLLRKGVEEFLEWDYIGAPWPETQCRTHRVGNGGLSIRNPAMMLKTANLFPKPWDMNDDWFFARHLAEAGARVAPLEVAERFSCETMFKLGTLGCHAINKYLTPAQVMEILTQYDDPNGVVRLEDFRARVVERPGFFFPEDNSQKILSNLGRQEEMLAAIRERVERLPPPFQWSRLEEPIMVWLAQWVNKHSKHPWAVSRQYPARPLVNPEEPRPKLKEYPSFAIVTPSLNQGQYIEQAIQSVVAQGYPHLNYHVQDGGSSDETMNIVKAWAGQYEFSYVSESDKNHSEALNRGFRRVKGDIMGFVNSDDLLCPNALFHVADFFSRHPEVDVVYGHRYYIDDKGREIGRQFMPQHDRDALRYLCIIPQETMFWRRSIWEKSGGYMDESYLYALDWEFELRLRRAGARFARIPRFLGCFRIHPEHKTATIYQTVGLSDARRLHLQEFGHHPRPQRVDYFLHFMIVRSFLTQVFGGIF